MYSVQNLSIQIMPSELVHPAGDSSNPMIQEPLEGSNENYNTAQTVESNNI